MVMEEKRIEQVSSHHWIRHKDQPIFHAYLRIRPGATSVCGQGKPFQSVREMDVPGDRSLCCAQCCEALYGFIGYQPPTDRKEFA